MSKMTIKTEGDRHVVVTRRFAAPPEAVYRAHTEPSLVQKWMLGPDGWTMPVCINDARPGGKIRYEWTNGKGGGFYLTGEYRGADALQPHRARRAHAPARPVPRTTTSRPRFEPDGAGTLMTMRMTLPDAADARRHAGERHGARHGSELRPPRDHDLRKEIRLRRGLLKAPLQATCLSF